MKGWVLSFYICVCLIIQSGPTLCDPMDYRLPGFCVHGDSPGKDTGVGCHALSQGIFLTQVSNPGLPHCRQILYWLSHQGSPSFYIAQVIKCDICAEAWRKWGYKPCGYVGKKLPDPGKIRAKTLRQSMLSLSREERGGQCSLSRGNRGECIWGMTYGALDIIIKWALTLIETGSHGRILSRGGAYQLMILKDHSGYSGE